MFGYQSTGPRVSKLRRDFRKRPEHEAVFEYVGSWDSYWRLVQHQFSMEQQVDIERSRQVPGFCAPAPREFVNFLNSGMYTCRTRIRLEANNKIEKIVAVETGRCAAVNARQLERAEAGFELTNGESQIFFRLSITANTEVDLGHGAINQPDTGREPRSI